MSVEEYISMLRGFENGDVRREEVGEEESEVEYEFLIRVGRRFVNSGDVGGGRDHGVDLGHDHVEEDDEFLVVFGTDRETSDFRETFEGNVSEFGNVEEL